MHFIHFIHSEETLDNRQILYLYIVYNFDIKWYTYFTIHSSLMLTCSDVIQIILVIYSEVILLYYTSNLYNSM